MRYLERHEPVLYGLLRLVGVVEDDQQALEAAGDRLAYVRRRIVWDQRWRSSAAPRSTSRRSTTGTTGSRSTHARLLDELARFAAIAGIRFERLALRQTLVDGFDGRTDRPTTCVRQLCRSCAGRSAASTPSRVCWPRRSTPAVRSTACMSPT